MIRLNIKLKETTQKIDIDDDYLFNAYLIEHSTLIKRLIHSVNRNYKISTNYFNIVNGYINFDSDKIPNYPGLIVRVDLRRYVVLYLEGTIIDEDVMIDLIREYIYDKGDLNPIEVTIDKFEITKDDFLNI